MLASKVYKKLGRSGGAMWRIYGSFMYQVWGSKGPIRRTYRSKISYEFISIYTRFFMSYEIGHKLMKSKPW
jgi:hypothetical protein